MPVILPTFKNTHCVSFTGCGFLTTNDPALTKWLKKDQSGVVLPTKLTEKNYVRVGLGGASWKHFHVDIFNGKGISKKSISIPIFTLDQIQKKVDRLINETIEIDFTGMFEVAIADLPENGIIKSLFFQTQLGDVAIKIKGSRLAIKGAPVNEITWQTLKDGEKIGVTIRAANKKTTITENYLSDGFNTLEQALKLFVLGK